MSRPEFNEFGPRNALEVKEINISLEEYEAIRLIDYSGMDQGQAAEIMEVSRQTVGRILKSGRNKVARALVKGLGLRVSGGCYRMGNRGHGKGRCGKKHRGR